MRSKFKISSLHPLWVVFAIGVILRVSLAIVNREANDDHMVVISTIADLGLFPGKDACWECYHPKFYHGFCAILIRLFSVGSATGRIILAQLVNAAAGSATLLIFKKFLKRSGWSFRTTLIAFSVFALNPELIGINAQATNDSFAILFSTAAIYSTWRIVQEFSWRKLLLLSLWTGLAILSKGSGWVLFVAEVVILSGVALRSKEKFKSYGKAVPILILLIVGTTPFIGPYASYAENYGSPFVINTHKDAAPSFFTATYVNRSGVTSIVDSYLTFRFFNMMETPYITQDMKWFPVHRTSLWSQLYGRWNSVHFGQYPLSWATTDAGILNLTRAIFVFALFPFALVLLGFGRDLRSWKKNDSWVFAVFALAFIGMILKMTYDYRCFCTMKAIYVFPALLCSIRFFAIGYENVRVRWIGDPAIAILAVLYVVDATTLFVQLAT